MIMPLEPSKPSISVSSWFKVCSRSSFPPSPLPFRFFPMASISSMNIMHGALAEASLKRSLTLAAPMPTYISTNSEPEILKNGTSASPATAFASSVLPVPGGPTSRAPLGILAPISLYFLGLCRKSTISASSSLASSSPATSANFTPVLSLSYTLALAFPKPPIMPPGPMVLILFESLEPSQISSMNGKRLYKSRSHGDIVVGISSSTEAPESMNLSASIMSKSLPVSYILFVSPDFKV